MKIYLAGPLFSKNQVDLLEEIEQMLDKTGYEYYSPRTDSGSNKMTPEDRKSFAAWAKVFESNERELDECDLLLAVLEYAMPEGQRLSICRTEEAHAENDVWVPEATREIVSIELPDSGTVWEMGYARKAGKLVVGFHRNVTKNLNLMLTHGTDGIVLGMDSLEKFLNGKTSPTSMPKRLVERDVPGRISILARDFDWSACWKEVETEKVTP